MQCNWQTQKMSSLNNIIGKIISSHMPELKRFLYGFRNFELTKNNLNLKFLQQDVQQRHHKENRHYFKTNLNSSKEDSQFDAAFKVLKINKIVKKSNQRNRPRADRTRLYEKMKKNKQSCSSRLWRTSIPKKKVEGVIFTHQIDITGHHLD